MEIPKRRPRDLQGDFLTPLNAIMDVLKLERPGTPRVDAYTQNICPVTWVKRCAAWRLRDWGPTPRDGGQWVYSWEISPNN